MCHLQDAPLATVAFVFICPGQREEAAGYPCAGMTGVHLEAVLARLHAGRPDIFASANRSAYVITNAWTQVEYRAKTKRSVPTPREIADPGNIQRLALELGAMTYVIACGKLAQRAVALCVQKHLLTTRIVNVRHLSQRAINALGSLKSATTR